MSVIHKGSSGPAHVEADDAAGVVRVYTGRTLALTARLFAEPHPGLAGLALDSGFIVYVPATPNGYEAARVIAGCALSRVDLSHAVQQAVEEAVRPWARALPRVFGGSDPRRLPGIALRGEPQPVRSYGAGVSLLAAGEGADHVCLIRWPRTFDGAGEVRVQWRDAGDPFVLLADLHGLATVRVVGERSVVEPGTALYRVARSWRYPHSGACEAGLLDACGDAVA